MFPVFTLKKILKLFLSNEKPIQLLHRFQAEKVVAWFVLSYGVLNEEMNKKSCFDFEYENEVIVLKVNTAPIKFTSFVEKPITGDNDFSIEKYSKRRAVASNIDFEAKEEPHL